MPKKPPLLTIALAVALLGLAALFLLCNSTKSSGFIDKSGKLIISIDGLEDAGEFHDGLAPVLVGKGWGYIDKQGKWAIPPQFREARNFSEDLAAVRLQSGKYSFINKDAKGIIEVDANCVGDFHNGVAMIANNGRCGYMDHSGQTIIPLMYEAPPRGSSIDAASDVVAVKDTSQNQSSPLAWKYVDLENNTIFEQGFFGAKQVSSGLAAVCMPNKENPNNPTLGKWGFIDKNGNIAIPPVYDDEEPFKEGMARITIKDKSGEGKSEKFTFINQENQRLSQEFDLANSFSDDVAVVGIKKDGELLFGYIDKSGNYIIKPRFIKANNFSEGLAFTARKALSRMPWQSY
ncbi:MAG: WG repeat-containing protein [Candidatus Obscuribacterales bacterium]|nr:WG repeat-containing protein [Candidatus Obscuribacterales bacterium]